MAFLSTVVDVPSTAEVSLTPARVAGEVIMLKAVNNPVIIGPTGVGANAGRLDPSDGWVEIPRPRVGATDTDTDVAIIFARALSATKKASVHVWRRQP